MGKRIVLISNIIFEPYWCKCIEATFAPSVSDVQTIFISYEELEGFGIGSEDIDAVVVCLNFEALYPNIFNDVLSGAAECETIIHDCVNRCKELYSFVKSCGGAKVIWFGFEDYFCYNNIYIKQCRY